MTHGPLSWRELVERDKQKSEDARGQIKRAAMQPTPRPQEAVMQSELKPCYLLMKRGLYYAPDRQGYTGVKAKAGRYRAIDALGLDGVSAIHEDDAAEFSPACWPDIKEAVLRAEITRLTEALRAAEKREKALREALDCLPKHLTRTRGAKPC